MVVCVGDAGGGKVPVLHSRLVTYCAWFWNWSEQISILPKIAKCLCNKLVRNHDCAIYFRCLAISYQSWQCHICNTLLLCLSIHLSYFMADSLLKMWPRIYWRVHQWGRPPEMCSGQTNGLFAPILHFSILMSFNYSKFIWHCRAILI